MSRPAVPRRAGARVLAGLLCAAVLTFAPASAEAAITLAGTSTSSSEANTITINRPAGTAAGDWMLMTVVATGTTAPTTPTGWTSVQSRNNASNLAMRTWRRLAAAGDPASFSVSVGGGRSSAGAIASYSGVDQATPVDASGFSVGANGVANQSSITTSEPSSVLIVPVGFSIAGGSGGTPTGTTRRYADASASTALVMGDELRTTPGAVGVRSSTSSAANTGWVTHAIALQEIPDLTATVPAAYGWGSWAIGTNTSAEQVVSVTSNRSWGVKLNTDGADGRMTEWNGTSYLSRKLGSALDWRLSSLGGAAQGTSFAAASTAQALVIGSQAGSAAAVPVGVTYRQTVTYADDAALGGNAYRKVITYQAGQGF